VNRGGHLEKAVYTSCPSVLQSEIAFPVVLERPVFSVKLDTNLWVAGLRWAAFTT